MQLLPEQVADRHVLAAGEEKEHFGVGHLPCEEVLGRGGVRLVELLWQRLPVQLLHRLVQVRERLHVRLDRWPYLGRLHARTVVAAPLCSGHLASPA